MHLLLSFRSLFFVLVLALVLPVGYIMFCRRVCLLFSSVPPLREHAATLVSNGWLAGTNDHHQTTSSGNERPPATDRHGCRWLSWLGVPWSVAVAA